MTKGVRFIDGREYLLCGRAESKTAALEARKALLASWDKVRIVKVWDYDFMLYVHGAKTH